LILDFTALRVELEEKSENKYKKKKGGAGEEKLA